MARRKDISLVLTFTDLSSAQVKKTLAKVEGQLKKHGVQVKKVEKGYQGVTKSTDEARTGMSRMQKVLKSTAAQMAIGMGAMMGIQGAMRLVSKTMRDVVRVGREFEVGWASVTTMLSIADGQIVGTTMSVEDMRKELIGMDSTLGKTTDLAKGMYQVLSASIEPSKAIMFLGEAAKSAQAGMTDTATSVDALTTVINAYGLAAEDVTDISDIMFQTVKRGKLTYEGMSSAIGTIAPIAAQVGVEFKEIAAAMATLTRQGIDVQTTTVQLRQVLVSVLKPTSEAQTAAKKLGLDFSSAALKAKGLAGFLVDLKEKVGDDNDALTALFGNVRALTGVMGLAGKGAAGFAKDLGLMETAAGATEIAFKKMMQTSDFMMKTLGITVDKLKIAFFEGLTAALRDNIDSSADLNTALENMQDKVRGFGRALAAIPELIIKHIDTIKVLIATYAIMWFWQKKIVAANIWMSLSSAHATYNNILAHGTSKMQAFRLVTRSTSLQIGKFAQGILLTTAAMASWKIGKWIGDIRLFGDTINTHITGAFERLLWNLPFIGKKMRDVQQEYTESLDTMAAKTQVMNDTLAEGFRFATEQAGKAVTDLDGVLATLGTTYLELGGTGNEVTTRWIENWIAAQGSTEEAAEAIKLLKEAFDKVKEPVDEVNKSLDTQSSLAKRLGLTLKKDLIDKLKDLKTALVEYKKELTVTEVEKMEKEIFELRTELGLVEEGFIDTAAALKKMREEMETAEKVTGTSGNAIKNILGPSLFKLIGQVEVVHKKIPEVTMDIESWTDVTGELADETKETGKVMESVWDEVAVDIGRSLADAAQSFTTFSNFIDDITKTTLRTWSTMVGDMVTKMIQGTDIIEADIKQMGRVFAAFVSVNLVQHLLEQFGILGARLDEESQAIVDNLDDIRAAGEEVRDTLINIGLTPPTIPPEISGEAPRLKAEVTDPWAEAIAGFDVYMGILDLSKEQLEGFDDLWGTLIDLAERYGKEGTKAFTDMIVAVRDAGLEIEALNDYVFGWLDTASKGLTAMADAIMPKVAKEITDLQDSLVDYNKELADVNKEILELEQGPGRKGKRRYQEQLEELTDLRSEIIGIIEDTDTAIEGLRTGAVSAQGELDTVGNLLLATFGAMIEQGASFGEALTAIQDPLTVLRDRYEVLGLDGGVAIEKLMGILKVKEANEELFAAIDGNRMVLQALGNTGFLTQEIMDDVMSQASNYYDSLINAGLTAEDALALMAPTLQDLQGYADEFGLALDPATQALVDQAGAAGLLKDEAKTTAEVLVEGFDAVVGKLDELINKLIGAGGVTDAIGSIGSAIDDVNTEVATSINEINNTAVDLDGWMPMLETVFDVTEGIKGIGTVIDEINAKSINPGSWMPLFDVNLPGGTGPKIGAAHGFEGTVTGPYQFNVEPGVREHVSMTPVSGSPRSGTPLPGGMDMGKVIALLQQLIAATKESGNIEIEPIVIPTGNDYVIELVTKKIERGEIEIPIDAVGRT